MNYCFNTINFNTLSAWQKRGVGFYWNDVKKEGYNPKNNEHVLVDRRILHIDFELPMRDEYNLFINDLANKYDNQD
jgi:tRNA(His) 5'-end guanylyltransferase